MMSLWNARSDLPLIKGDKAVIERVGGFILTLKRVLTISRSGKKK
jgi:hypothetical protein